MADFGLANFADSTAHSISTQDAGPRTPERCFSDIVLGEDHKYIPSTATDVFAYGVAYWEVNTIPTSLSFHLVPRLTLGILKGFHRTIPVPELEFRRPVETQGPVALRKQTLLLNTG